MSNELIPVTQAASAGWFYWLATNAGSAAIGNAASAATQTFLTTLISPAITGSAVVAGYAASIAFSLTINTICWTTKTAAAGLSTLWQRQQEPTPTFRGNAEGNLGFY